MKDEEEEEERRRRSTKERKDEGGGGREGGTQRYGVGQGGGGVGRLQRITRGLTTRKSLTGFYSVAGLYYTF